MNRILRLAAFLAGLAVAGWVGAGYAGGNPLALVMTAAIVAFYVLGASELERFRRATDGLRAAVDALEGPIAELGPWLERLPPTLRPAVRRRIEGEPSAMPGPALAPYLVGLLVLLGMLGTFLGMVLTLRGTGIALENATDLTAVRSSLVAPVQGLGLAFGTSVAGVATSAMLGLLSALARRERAQAVQALDARIATTLRPHSGAHRRAASLEALQQQAGLMPAVVDRLQAMMDALERRAEAADDRLLARQEAFLARTEAAYTSLVAAVDRSLQDSLRESARQAGATLGPAVESTLSTIARESAGLQASLGTAMTRQLDELHARLAAANDAAAAAWQAASERHERGSARLHECMAETLGRFSTSFDERSAALVQSVAASHARQQDAAGERDAQRLAAMSQLLETLSAAQADQQAAADQRDAQRLAAVTQLLEAVAAAHATQQDAADARDAQRATALSQLLEGQAAALRLHWERAGAEALERQQAFCDTLADTAQAITSGAETQARATIAEIGRLVEAASEAPRAAAEVIGELRQRLSDGLARDNALLDERARVLEISGTLLETVQKAAGEQREAIDALVATAASMLERAGERLGAQGDAQAGRLESVATQLTAGAVEVASLGEAFGAAVGQFAASNDALAAHLARVGDALDQASTRSDEQLAYYVAQAREVIDLSILSQQRIFEDLQRLAARQAPAGAAA
jgi:hypothetical protein